MLFPMRFYTNNLDCTKRLNGGQFLVLLALSHFASRALGECYPGVERLAEFAHVTPRSIKSNIKALEEHGHIKRLEGQGQPTRRGATNLYQLGAYREHIGLTRFDEGQGLSSLIKYTLMAGMKPDEGRAFELRRAIETSASESETVLTPENISRIGAFFSSRKYDFADVTLNTGKLKKELIELFKTMPQATNNAPAPKPAPVLFKPTRRTAHQATVGALLRAFNIEHPTKDDIGKAGMVASELNRLGLADDVPGFVTFVGNRAKHEGWELTIPSLVGHGRVSAYIQARKNTPDETATGQVTPVEAFIDGEKFLLYGLDETPPPLDEKPIQPKSTSDEDYTLPPDYSGGSFTLDGAIKDFMAMLDTPPPLDESSSPPPDEIPF